MKTFNEFLLEYTIITEELHQDLKDILNTPETDRESGGYTPGKFRQQKLNTFTKKFRSLVANGEKTGIEGDKPKKGSSRAVFFTEEPKKINVDGQDVDQPTVVKIAFPGILDRYTGSPHLLGEHQNAAESDFYTRQNHSMLHRENDGSYTTNPHGVTAPILDDPDHHNHWLEMAKADKLTGTKFTALTKTDTHPKGLNFNKFVDTLQNDHKEAQGIPTSDYVTSYEEQEHIKQHPLYDATQDFMYSVDHHPGDLRKANYGVWTHPVTGKEHVVITDSGFNKNAFRLYNTARRNKYNIKYNIR